MIKWIGQHIVDFIARFRSDVYLENIADGTVASDKFLGLDSNNKIVKETVSAAVTDLHSVGVDGAANQLLTDDGDGTITSEALLTHDGGEYIPNTQLFSGSVGGPILNLVNTVASAGTNGVLTFTKQRGTSAADAVDGDNLGTITFSGYDDGTPSVQTYASIFSEIIDSGSGAETGRLELNVAEYDGTVTTGLKLDGQAADGEIDVTIGAGAASTTTVAGNLTAVNGVVSIESHATVDAQIKSTGKLNFVLDSDSDETGQSFGFFANALHGSQKIMDLAEDATLQVGDGFASGTVSIYNQVDDANSGELKFQTLRGAIAADAQDDDAMGKISFWGHDDGTPSVQQYGEVTCIAADVTSGQEAGAMIFKVAEFDGTVTQGMKLEGNTDANGEVDVNIAAGAASTTTVAGDLVVAGKTLAIGAAADIEPKITLTNDENSVEIGIANAANDMVDLSVDGDLVINSVGDHNIILAQNDAQALTIDTSGNTALGKANLVSLVTLKAIARSNSGGGKILSISGGAPLVGETDSSGGNLLLNGGTGTGTGVGGDVKIITYPPAGSTGTSFNFTPNHQWKFTDEGNFTAPGDISSQKITTTHDYDTTTFETQFDADNEGSGEILRFGSAQTGAIGQLHYLVANQSWAVTDADDVATGASQLLGVAMGSDPGVNGMLLDGYFRIDPDNIEGTAVVGAPLYVSEAPGKFDATAPSANDDFVRIVGYCVDYHTDGDGSVLIRFKPDNTHVKITA